MYFREFIDFFSEELKSMFNTQSTKCFDEDGDYILRVLFNCDLRIDFSIAEILERYILMCKGELDFAQAIGELISEALTIYHNYYMEEYYYG